MRNRLSLATVAILRGKVDEHKGRRETEIVKDAAAVSSSQEQNGHLVIGQEGEICDRCEDEKMHPQERFNSQHVIR